ncbi:nicotinate (nicotinamide) nucleotide adenylyltransferase [Psychrobacter phenylpyruvicus]|uniref:Probable nicotinate-nucleotide adenylyltransferase n=1 Tax=Psychrobacter phenylpyruvicus TaxID=29432 RepID=A0A379LMA7_9GAMM|nr:nicotinate (nicotinamide) nucleotide adenylyltransferase [Psychrobacter phenylpyruvicus]SUD91683.1 Probable nicotinate-nucleotide adenylyltransferase [Psychrobacter phenylpyruvicus]
MPLTFNNDNTNLPSANIGSKQRSSKLPIEVYLGGSFDPVHNSHLALLTHVYHKLATDNHPVNAYFMPTSRSPLKTDSSASQHRLNMLNAAITELQTGTLSSQTNCIPLNLAISEYEIWQTPPTYTIDTLAELRQQYPNHSLVFIIGADNIASLPKWRDGDKLTQFAHLWVFPRDELQTAEEIIELLPESLKPQVSHCLQDLKLDTHGRIYIDSHTVAPLSSSAIREAIAQGKPDIAKSALPRSVYSYIMKNNLYHSY